MTKKELLIRLKAIAMFPTISKENRKKCSDLVEKISIMENDIPKSIQDKVSQYAQNNFSD